MKAKIKLNGKEIVIDDIRKVSGLERFSGLMFKKNSQALLFEFSTPGRRGIHSLFCSPFVAVWILGGRVTEFRAVNGWEFSVLPEGKFDRLIEIPMTEKYIGILEQMISVDNS